MFIKKKFFVVLLLVLSSVLGILTLKSSFILPQNHIANLVHYNTDSVYTITGMVDSVLIKDNRGSSFILLAQGIQNERLYRSACGKILVNLDWTPDLKYGDLVSLNGKLSSPPNFSNSGYRDYLRRQGIYYFLHIKSSLQFKKIGEGGGHWWMQLSLSSRQKIESVFEKYLSELPASILEAMVLGLKTNLPKLVNNSMVKSGTVHILVVSGFNVGMVAFSINLCLKILRFRRKARLIVCLICLIFYCFITGASNPVVRATIMGIILLSAYLVKREADIYNSLAISALIILIFSPQQIFDIGFQLSFISVFSIVFIYPKLILFFKLKEIKFIPFKFLLEGFCVSFSAWLGTVGIIAYNFRIFSPVTVLANIFVVPLATLITLCGFLLAVCGLFLPVLAHPISLATELFIAILLRLNNLFVHLPFAYFYIKN